MKSTGIVRQIDDLGRVLIPKELKKVTKLKEGDSIKFFVKDEDIIIRKYDPGCIFCGSIDNNFEYQHITICKECYEKMGNEVE